MENKFLEWAKRKYTKRQRLLMLIPLAPVFLVIIPLVILFLSNYIDRLLRIPRFILQPTNLIVGIVMILVGLTFALWSIESQFKIGKGTPVPMMPTHKLVIVRPFLYCRNPMTLGTILMYLGVSVVIGSLASFGLVILMALALILYIKLVEEKELELRFGKEYLEYKKSTPFMIPRIKLK